MLQRAQMKRFVLLLLLSFLWPGVFSTALAGESDGVAILYTGLLAGNLEPVRT